MSTVAEKPSGGEQWGSTQPPCVDIHSGLYRREAANISHAQPQEAFYYPPALPIEGPSTVPEPPSSNGHGAAHGRSPRCGCLLYRRKAAVTRATHNCWARAVQGVLCAAQKRRRHDSDVPFFFPCIRANSGRGGGTAYRTILNQYILKRLH